MQKFDERCAALNSLPSWMLAGESAQAICEGGNFLCQKFEELGAWYPRDQILEVGSGVGRLAMGFCTKPGDYLGLEPRKALVHACERIFSDCVNVRFAHFDVYNSAYSPDGLYIPESVSFPMKAESFDLVIFCSVFTHLENIEACRNYLNEAKRVLRHGGRCLTTWFVAPPNNPTNDVWRSVFSMREIVESMLGWTVLASCDGTTSLHHDQWMVVLQKP